VVYTVDNCPGSGRLRPQSMTRRHQQTTAICSVCGVRLVVHPSLQRTGGNVRLPRHRALREDGGIVTRWRQLA